MADKEQGLKVGTLPETLWVILCAAACLFTEKKGELGELENLVCLLDRISKYSGLIYSNKTDLLNYGNSPAIITAKTSYFHYYFNRI